MGIKIDDENEILKVVANVVLEDQEKWIVNFFFYICYFFIMLFVWINGWEKSFLFLVYEANYSFFCSISITLNSSS